jgi:hypothetical protein
LRNARKWLNLAADDLVPLATLGIVHAELNRQRESTRTRHEAMHQRAALLIGAATVVTGVQAARIPQAIAQLVTVISKDWPFWHLLLAGASVIFAAGAAAVSVLAAICGLRVVMVEHGSEIDAQKFAVNALGAGAGPYAVEWSLVADKLAVHAEDNLRLEARRSRFVTGSRLLAVAWVLFVLQFCVSV